MIVVADTGPLIGLAKLDSFSLLTILAAEITIPPAVHRELLGKPGDEAEVIDRALEDLIRVEQLPLLGAVAEKTIAPLDEGERQAVGLASTHEKDVLLLMDDRAGRRAARQLNIPVTGLAGLLLRAKEKNHVEAVVPLLRELQRKGYWLSDEVIDAAGRLAGEIGA